MTSFIGMDGLRIVDVLKTPAELQKGDIVMLCSDGIYRFVEEDTLKSVLQRMYRSLFLTKGAVERLVKTAVDNDTKDNYSLIAVKI